MADVGVLNLQIKSNAQSAATGLGNLADALSRVKTAVGKGALSGKIEGVATALERLKRVTDNSFNTKAFNSIIKAIGDASKNIGDNKVADRFGKAATAMERYAAAYRELAEIATGRTKTDSMPTLPGRLKTTLGQFGGRGKKKQDPMQMSMDLDNLQKSIPIMEEVQAKIHEVTTAAKEFNISLQEVGDTVTSIKVNPFEDMYRTFSKLAHEFHWFSKEAMRLGSGMKTPMLGPVREMMKLTEGGVTPDKMLSTWIDRSASWMPNWGTGTDWTPDWVSAAGRNAEGIEGEGWIHPDVNLGKMREYLDMLKEMSSYATMPTGRGSWDDISSGINNANTAADAFYHTMERTNELVQNMAWNAGNMAEIFSQLFNAWSDVRSAMALDSGLAGYLGTGGPVNETGWTQYNPWGGTAETGWVFGEQDGWKNGAIEVEGTVSDATDNINGYLEGTQLRLTGIIAETQKVTAATDDWLQKAMEVNQTMAARYASFKDRSMEDVFFGRYWGRDKEGNEFQYTRPSDLAAKWLQGDGSEKEQTYAIEQFAKSFGLSAEEARAKIEELRAKLREATGETENLRGAMDNVANAAGALGGTGGGRVSAFFHDFKAGIKNLHMPLAGLVHQFARIAKYRMLRAVLKHITEGFREGTENVYRYSQAIGSSFAPTMDSLSSTMSQFKNSIGAAVAPFLQAIIPILNQITNAAIGVINVLNQLFSLLSGKGSWTRALPQTSKAFDDVKQSAGGAGSAVKEMLASFDELNVIASESGGGGGGASAAVTDFESMFEEVYAFDEKVRDFVNWLHDNMESIKGIAIATGAAILSWKLANAFAEVLPVLATVFGAATTGLVIAITLQATWMLTNRYLDTGEPGWLIADALTTAVGATAAAAIAKKFIGGNAAAYTAAITLTLSAVTGIVALLGRTDVAALSTESIATAVENALKVGAAATILLKTVGGASMGTALAGGAAATLFTFGVVIGLKTILDPNVETFSADHVTGAALSALTIGLSLGLYQGSLAVGSGAALITFAVVTAAKAILDENMEVFSEEYILASLGTALEIGAGIKLLGGSWKAAGGSALITFSIMTAAKVLLDENIEVFSPEFLTSSLEAALTAGIGIKMLEGSWKAAGGTALLVFGALTGVKAMLQKKDVEVFSEEYLKSVITSAVTTGLGVFLTTGNPLGAAITAIGVFGALIAVKLCIGKKNIEWGTISLTSEQVQEFVNEKLFKIDVKTSIERIQTTIENTAVNKTELRTALSEMIGTLKVLKIGVADNQDYAKLKSQVDTVVDKARSYATSAQNVAKLTLQFTPTLVGDDETKQGEWFSSYTEGWGVVDQWFADKGAELGKLFVENEKGEIIASKPDLIAEISKQIEDVTQAIAKADINSESYAGLKIGLGDLTQASASDVVTLFGQYKTDLQTEYEKLVQDQYTKQAELVAALFKIDPESEAYKDAKERYTEMGLNLVGAVEEGVNSAIEPGKDLIMKWILENHKTGSVDTTWTDELLQSNVITSVTDTIQQLLDEAHIDPIEIEAMNIVGFTGWDLLADDLQKKIVQYACLRPDTLQELKDSFGLTADEIIQLSGWETFEENEQQRFLSAMAQIFGEDALSGMQFEVTNVDITDMIKVSGWQTWGEEEQKKYIETLEDVFGSYEVKNALMSMGKDVPKWVAEGFNKRQDLKNALDKFGKYLKEAGITAQEIITDWKLTAPLIDNYSIEESAEMIGTIVKECGKDSRYILEHWNLIAPEVTNTPLKDTLAAIKKLSQTTGVDIKTLIANWNLIAPKIDKTNVDSSLDSISKVINTNRSNWVEVLKKVLKTGNVETPDKFGNAVTDTVNKKRGTWDTTVGGKFTTGDVNTPDKFGNSAKNTIDQKVKDFKSAMKVELPTGDINTPSKFGESAREKVKAAIKNLKTDSNENLVTGDIVLPQKYGDNTKEKIKEKIKEFKNEISGDITTGDVNTPAGFGNDAGKTISKKRGDWDEAMGAYFTTGNVNLPDKFGVDADKGVGDTLWWLQQTAGKDLVTGDLKTPDNFGSDFLGDVDYLKQTAKGILEGIKPKIEVSAQIDVDMNATAELVVHNAQIKGVNTEIKHVNNHVTIDDMVKGTGAYGIPSGDIFIANENGPELVGSMAGKTTVANQEQIIEGIQRGVSDANEEQNLLLREQNDLLRKLLAKDSSLRLGASAQLGRIASQSLAMYGTMVGG